MTRGTLSWFIAVACSLLLAGCCGKVTPTSVEVDTTPILHVNGPQGQVAVKLGEEAIELPAGFPDDLPIPEGAEPQVVYNHDGKWFFSCEMQGMISGVSQPYSDALEAQGWQIETPNEALGSSLTLSATKDDQRLVLHAANGAQNNHTLTLAVSPK